MGFFSKIKAGLQKTKANISEGITNIINSFTKIDEDFFEELEELLVMSDVGVETSVKICDELRVRVKRDGITDPTQIKGMMHDIIFEMLGDGFIGVSKKNIMSASKSEMLVVNMKIING